MAEKITGQVKIKRAIIKNILAFKEEIIKSFNQEITKTIEIILGGSIILDASDIHIEPEEEGIKIRVRIDGILHEVVILDQRIYQILLSRIKLLSGLKLNIIDKAQDGRFSILVSPAESGTNNKTEEIETRVSVLPSQYGESIVIRILNPKSLIEIEDLGIREDMLEIFKKEIKKPNGMIIVTGPTGSGKTTTLYAILKRLENPEIKIITIEDQIEYHLEGITQTQVAPEKGYDFANGLRAIVRQDPDVILVGEIRDLDTAKTAIQAALTGHLVLTTLHTNDAAHTVARLQALGEIPINIAPAINIAIAQRLVRKICKKCVKFLSPTNEELETLEKELSLLPKEIKIPSLDKDLKIPKPTGCQFCNFTGYKGRIGIYEFFLVDDEIENFILKSPSISDLKKIAEKKGMVSMRCDGLIKTLLGTTTIEEVNRVTSE